MAYSDYGGFAYKDGELRTDRCDVTIYQEDSSDTSMRWPMFFGKKQEGEQPKLPNAHVSLGDKEVRVMLYKQSWFEIWKDGKELDKFDILCEKSKEEVPDYKTDYTDDDKKPYFNTDAFLAADRPAVFEFDGYKLEMCWEHTDNYYQYGRLTQPDGTVWTGFSGYGVGNGLSDAGYGFDTSDNELRLKEIF